MEKSSQIPCKSSSHNADLKMYSYSMSQKATNLGNFCIF